MMVVSRSLTVFACAFLFIGIMGIFNNYIIRYIPAYKLDSLLFSLFFCFFEFIPYISHSSGWDGVLTYIGTVWLSAWFSGVYGPLLLNTTGYGIALIWLIRGLLSKRTVMYIIAVVLAIISLQIHNIPWVWDIIIFFVELSS